MPAVAELARMLKAIHAQEDRASPLAKNAEVIAKLNAMKLPRAAELVNSHGQATNPSCRSFPGR